MIFQYVCQIKSHPSSSRNIEIYIPIYEISNIRNTPFCFTLCHICKDRNKLAQNLNFKNTKTLFYMIGFKAKRK